MSQNNIVTGIEEIRAAVSAVIESEEMTLTAISKASTVSTSALSQFIKGTYNGNNAEVSNKLCKWLESRNARESIAFSAPRFIETTAVKTIWNTLRYAQAARRIAIIYGNSGVGKSVALREFVTGRPNVWMVTIKPSTSGLLECLFEIADAMGLSDAPRRAGALCRAIRRRMMGTNGLLVVDESDHLDYPVLEELRLLQEETGIGLVLCGNHKVYAKLTGGNSRTVDFARLFSRIAKKVTIDKVRKVDIDAIADAWGLTGATERDLVHSLAAKGGALRTVSTTLDLASLMAQGDGVQLTERYIRAAVKDLEGI